MDTNRIKTGARLLETLTSALYAEPIVVFREYVQNAIDSFVISKSKPDFRVEIVIDSTKSRVIIRDNGDGIPPEEFNEVMMSLGKSPKEVRKNQIGFRGIGRLAGLSFCKHLHFINKSNPQKPEQFSLNGEKYREILSEVGGGSLDLDEVMGRIVATNAPLMFDNQEGNANNEQGFEVWLEDILPELRDCIYLRKPKRGTLKQQTSTEGVPPSEAEQPTDDFVNALSLLLPVPYTEHFVNASEIRHKYQEWFHASLATKEFKVLLNGRQLFKPFKNDKGMYFCILPIQIADLEQDRFETLPSAPKTVGLLWMRFDYVFKAVKQNWGIAVRSKNMLVRGGSVLAEEASSGRHAVTSYNQYLAAIKGVNGELLLETDWLSDNSRRDWFKMDKNSLQLRDKLCQLMNRMHIYRYKISQYVHNDIRTETDRQQVIKSFQDLISQQNDSTNMTAIEQYMDERLQTENAKEIDDRADERDILGYTMTQKKFYKTLMMSIYGYFEEKEITDYYALKSYILRKLNRESNNSETGDISQDE